MSELNWKLVECPCGILSTVKLPTIGTDIGCPGCGRSLKIDDHSIDPHEYADRLNSRSSFGQAFEALACHDGMEQLRHTPRWYTRLWLKVKNAFQQESEVPMMNNATPWSEIVKEMESEYAVGTCLDAGEIDTIFRFQRNMPDECKRAIIRAIFELLTLNWISCPFSVAAVQMATLVSTAQAFPLSTLSGMR